MLKACTKCSDEKELSLFRVAKGYKDNLFCWCKDCEANYRKLNREKIKTNNQIYRKKNRDILKLGSKKYYLENKRKLNEKNREYYKNNRDAINESRREYGRKYAKDYYWKNRENILADLKKPEKRELGREYLNNYRKSHPEKVKDWNKANTAIRKERGNPHTKKYYRKHRDKILLHRKSNRHIDRERARIYRKNNPEKKRLSDKYWSYKRRQTIKENGGTITLDQIKDLLVIQKNECYWCDKEMAKYTLDHFEPLSKGGVNDISNIVLACKSCNSSKNNKSPYEFSEQLEKQLV